MAPDLDSYEFQGDELLDRLDDLNAAVETAGYHIQLYREKLRVNGFHVPDEYYPDTQELDHTMELVQQTHEELDQLFRQELTKFPIETVAEDSNGNPDRSVNWMKTEADSYREIVEALEEINLNLSEREPWLDHSQVPSAITLVDYSDELIEAYRRLESTYRLAEEVADAGAGKQ